MLRPRPLALTKFKKFSEKLCQVLIPCIIISFYTLVLVYLFPTAVWLFLISASVL